MSYANISSDRSALVQAELRKKAVEMKQQKAITLQSLKRGNGGKKKGAMAGLMIPFAKNVAHGDTALDPISGQTSFEKMTPETYDRMYVGLAYTGFTVEYEHFHSIDMANGKIPQSKLDLRNNVMATYMQHRNWYAIGSGNGALAVVSSFGGGTVTCAYDATARGRSKGSIRLAVSESTASGKRVEYQNVDSSGTVNGTFYVTSKPSATQAAITVVSGSNPATGEIIVKKGHYNKVPYGCGTHFNYSDRLYQGVNTANFDFLNSSRVNAGGSLVTPTMIDTAKAIVQTGSNDTDARKKITVRLTIANYKQLASFGYTLREYNAEKGDANTTYGLPFVYEDEDAAFIQDADYEEAVIDVHHTRSYFEYSQSDIREISKGETQYVGTNLVGSTEMYQNFGEACNMAFDGRGEDGAGEGGRPNTSVVIDNLAMPTQTQVAQGRSLV